MNTPVSVIIPTFNREQLLPRAINSVLRQMGPEDEVLVIDDDSTDNTAAVVARYKHVRYLRKPHGGAGAARNLGIDESRNPLIAFLDSDDEWLPGKITLQRRLMEALPDAAYCFSDFRVVDREGNTYPRYLKKWHHDPRPWSVILGDGETYSSHAPLPHGAKDLMVYQGDLFPSLLERPYVATFTLLFRKETRGDPPRFAEDLPIFEDWEFFGKLARARLGVYLDCETAIQHGHEGMRLTQAHALTQVRSRLKLMQRVWGADEEFQRQHAARYRALVEELETMQRFCSAKELLRTGHMREARAAFQAIGHYPALYRVLLVAPGIVMRTANRLRGSTS